MNRKQVLSGVRSVLKIFGTYLVAHYGTADDAVIMAIGLGAFMLLLGLAWSWCEHANIEICQTRAPSGDEK